MLTERALAGRYRLIELLGEGGMALVYRAHDDLLDRGVAVKVLRSGFAADPEFVSRFRQEARAAASLHHPNIATVYDTGTDEGVDFIVMQLVDGEDLEHILERDVVCRSTSRSASWSTWLVRCRRPMSAASSIATSSQPTSSSTGTGTCGWSTSGSRAQPTRPSGSRRPE